MPYILIFVLMGLAFTVILGLYSLAAWQGACARVIRLRCQVNEAVGAEAAQLQERLDLIPAAWEAVIRATQVQMLYLRQIQNGYRPDHDIAELSPLEAAAANSGPRPPIDVKSYEELLKIMAETEKNIAAARRFVQAAVSEYNAAIAVFPLSFVASARGLVALPTRQITPELEKMPKPPQLPTQSSHD